MNKYLRVLIGILLLNLIISACGLSPSGDQGQPTFVAVAPVNTTASVEAVPSPTATLDAEELSTAPAESPPVDSTPADIPTEAALSFPYPTSFPDPAKYEWQLITDGLSRPVGLTNAGDGSGRLFALEQEGVIRIVQDYELL